MCWSRLQFLSKLDTVKDMEKHVAIIIPGGIERLQFLTLRIPINSPAYSDPISPAIPI